MQRSLDEFRDKERARYEREREQLEKSLQEEARRSQSEQQEKLEAMRRCAATAASVAYSSALMLECPDAQVP